MVCDGQNTVDVVRMAGNTEHGQSTHSQLTVNSQSTHSQLTVNSTVNSQSTHAKTKENANVSRGGDQDYSIIGSQSLLHANKLYILHELTVS